MAVASAAGLTASSAPSTTALRSTGRTSRRIFPVMTRETSSRSSINCTWALAFRTIASSARSAAPSRICPVCSIRAQPYTALSGVRSSCDRTVKNSSLARLAASDWARAICSLRRSCSRSASPRVRSSAAVASASATSRISWIEVSGGCSASRRPMDRAEARRSPIGPLMLRAIQTAASVPSAIESRMPPP